MARADEQREAEQSIFWAFAEAASLSVVSVESREPPEPDLICEIAGVGTVAFEVGIVAGEPLQRAISSQLAARRKFQTAYAALPADDRLRIEERLGGIPAVHATFLPSTSPGRWHTAVEPILDYLVRHARVADGPEALRPGDIGVWRDSGLTRHLSDLSVRRTTTRRPFFGVVEAVRVVDAAPRMLEKKLSGTYTSAVPMELVLYWSAQPAPATVEWRENIIELIRARRPSSCFRRVWCFDLFDRAVVIVEPPHDE
jgi:hypothetical protein